MGVFPCCLHITSLLFCCWLFIMSQDRIAIFPTRMALTTMKLRVKGAQQGHSLLKKKADAMTIRFRAILQKIVENKKLMGQVMNEAIFALTQANYVSNDWADIVRQTVK